jgi:hypothetical protein
MVDANLVRRRRFWWPLLAAAALLLALGIGMVTREDGGADGEPAADAEDGTVTVAESLAADALVEPGQPAAKAAQPFSAAVDSVERGPWGSREQAGRMRHALLSAADVLEALAQADDAATPASEAAAEARKSAASIRAGLPVAQQTEPVDAFLRNAGDALRLMEEQRD